MKIVFHWLKIFAMPLEYTAFADPALFRFAHSNSLTMSRGSVRRRLCDRFRVRITHLPRQLSQERRPTSRTDRSVSFMLRTAGNWRREVPRKPRDIGSIEVGSANAPAAVAYNHTHRLRSLRHCQHGRDGYVSGRNLCRLVRRNLHRRTHRLEVEHFALVVQCRDRHKERRTVSAIRGRIETQ